VGTRLKSLEKAVIALEVTPSEWRRERESNPRVGRLQLKRKSGPENVLCCLVQHAASREG
jgi:hypothetical protein